MIAEGTDVASITEDTARQVWHQVELFIKRHRITRKDLGRDVGYSPSVISETLAGTYAGDWRRVTADLDAWMESEERRRTQPENEPDFVWTSVAEEVRTVAGLCAQLRKIGLIYGPDTSGIGKTMAMRALHQEMPGSLLVTCDKVLATPTGVLRAIAAALRIGNGSNRGLYSRIVSTLAGTSRLLMIDQIHNLRRTKDDKALYVLTDLYDATRAPQLWCGTADMVAYLRGRGRGDESLAQVRSRICIVRDLMDRCGDGADGGHGEPLVSIEQIRAMYGRKMRIAPDGIRMLYELANMPDSGSLRLCTTLTQIAAIVAKQRNVTTIDANMLLAALRDSVSGHVFREIKARIAIDAPRAARSA